MNKNTLKVTAAATLTVLAGGLYAAAPTAPYNNSSIDARLNVTVKPDTDVVHFIRDNNDPNVITKVYVLKHADPYELRTYLRKIVQSRRVTDQQTNLKAIKYSDGTSVLLISAEDYRFNDTPGTQGFDTLIKTLDRPKITASSGRPTYVYAPKFGKASDLAVMVGRIGANTNDAPNTLGATDAIATDDALNLMFFKTAPFSCQSINSVLKEYDRPTPEVRTKVTIYEIYAENDTKLGLDFQAWKNNDGMDFFSAGGRFMRNYTPDGSALLRGGKWFDTSYFNFNPKWNTKYIDFLTSKGKAKVLHTCEMVLTNGKPGSINRMNEIFVANAVPAAKQVIEYTAQSVAAGQNVGSANGSAITAKQAGDMTIFKVTSGTVVRYVLNLAGGFVVNGSDVGNRVTATSIAFADLKFNPGTPAGGNAIDTVVAAIGDENGYGFKMTMTPAVSSAATVLDIKISNTSLIGYKSDGSPRISKGAEISSKFMISSNGTKLVIGGIEKRDVVRVSGGIPLLKDLPVLGWLFSTESESTKKSQLLVVAEVLPVKGGETFTAEQKKTIQGLNEDLKKAGESNTFGYRQFLLDPSRK